NPDAGDPGAWGGAGRAVAPGAALGSVAADAANRAAAGCAGRVAWPSPARGASAATRFLDQAVRTITTDFGSSRSSRATLPERIPSCRFEWFRGLDLFRETFLPLPSQAIESAVSITL